MTDKNAPGDFEGETGFARARTIMDHSGHQCTRGACDTVMPSPEAQDGHNGEKHLPDTRPKNRSPYLLSNGATVHEDKLDSYDQDFYG